MAKSNLRKEAAYTAHTARKDRDTSFSARRATTDIDTSFQLVTRRPSILFLSLSPDRRCKRIFFCCRRDKRLNRRGTSRKTGWIQKENKTKKHSFSMIAVQLRLFQLVLSAHHHHLLRDHRQSRRLDFGLQSSATIAVPKETRGRQNKNTRLQTCLTASYVVPTSTPKQNTFFQMRLLLLLLFLF